MTVQQIENYPLTEAKDKFSALTARANATGVPFRVLKGGRPWVIVSPISANQPSDQEGITIQPIRRTVAVPDLDVLFANYDGAFVPSEDGLASPVGSEEM